MKTPDTIRNPHAISANSRKSGELRPKKDKRKNGKNKKIQYLHDDY